MAVGSGSKITKIEIHPQFLTVDFYFEGSDEPWNVVEFVAGSPTHAKLSKIESAVIQFNANGGVR